MSRLNPNFNFSAGFNPVIPSIAFTCLGLYLITLAVDFISGKRRARGRPKLVVCCDIQRFEEETFYLISVETGKRWWAGTSCFVYCYLCGEKGTAGPFPLNDNNLETVRVLQRNQEDNYLISHDVDLGEINRLVICYDNKRKTYSTWKCKRVTVRNLKTDESWSFFMSSAIKAKRSVAIFEFFPADRQLMDRLSKVSVNCRHFVREMARFHTFISPFISPTKERIMLMFAELMSYMFWLTYLFGFPEAPEDDFNGPNGEHLITLSVLGNESIAAILGSLCGAVFDIFYEFGRVTRIPTLLVWQNKNAHGPYQAPSIQKITNLMVAQSRDGFPRLPVLPEKKAKPALGKGNSTKVPEKKHKTHQRKGSPTQVPEKQTKPTPAPGNATQVPEIQTTTAPAPGNATQVPEIQTTTAPAPGNATKIAETQLKSALSKENSKQGVENENKSIWHNISTLFVGDSTQVPQKQLSEQSLMKAVSTLILHDSIRDVPKLPVSILKPSSMQAEHFYELVEMDSCYYWKTCIKQVSLWVGWILCNSMILMATFVCLVYGGRYGYRHRWDWVVTFLSCWIQNFFLYQLIKILIVVVVVTLMVRNKKLSSFEAEKTRRRFHIERLHPQSGTEIPKTYKLKYELYLPREWEPPDDNVMLPEDEIEKMSHQTIHSKSRPHSKNRLHNSSRHVNIA